jgi:hypothetical protein
MSERELTNGRLSGNATAAPEGYFDPSPDGPADGLSGLLCPIPPKYTSTSTVLVEGQKVPDSTSAGHHRRFCQRVQSLQEEVLSPSRLRPLIQGLETMSQNCQGGRRQTHLRSSKNVHGRAGDDLDERGRGSWSGMSRKKSPRHGSEPVPGFNVTYTDSDGVRAQKICNAVTQLIVDQNLISRSDVAQSTTDFLSRQLDDAKRTVDDSGCQTGRLQEQYMGQLPTDVDNNMRMLMSLNSQLDATTQTLAARNRIRPTPKACWRSNLPPGRVRCPATNPQTLEQQLTQLQGAIDATAGALHRRLSGRDQDQG